MFFKSKNITDKEKLKEAGEELRKGSAEAFHILYETYNKRVYRFCLRLCGEEQIAQDAFQETFIKVYENRKSFRGKNFAAWLFTIARHTCLNMLRSKKDFETFDEFYHSSLKSNVPDVGMTDFIKYSISKLPISLREALLLREYEECSYQEIADILGIELSLAKVRVHRARIILRKLLKPLVKELNESR